MDGPRAVAVDELPLVEELMNDVFRAPGGLAPMAFALSPRVLAPENAEHVWAVFDGGRPVATVSYVLDQIALEECPFLAASLSPAATREDYRRRGLASLLLDHCLGLMRAEGVRLLIDSGDRGLYRRAGSCPGGIVWRAVLDREALPPAGDTVCRAAGPADLPALWRLHQEENPRFVWTEDQYGRVFAAETLACALGCESHPMLVLRGGRPLAYSILLRPKDGGTTGYLQDYAGDRRALSGALRAMTRRLGLEALEINVPFHDGLFLERLRAAGGAWQARTMPGLIDLLDPVGLWSDLRPYFVRRLGENAVDRLRLTGNEEIAVSLRYGQEALVVQDRERLVHLLFGAGDSPRPDRALPGNMRRLLASCLPIPLPWLQGLNHV
ncbi:MAG: GNAT family N-acetyltransferase [Bacteroidota bacterium]